MKKFFLISAMLLCGFSFLKAQNLPEGVIMPDRPKTKAYVDYSWKESGFWAGLDLASGASVNVDPKYATAVTTDIHAVAGYRFNSFIMIGAGVGAKIYAPSGNRVDAKYPGNIVSIPVFFNARGVMIDPRSRVTLPCWSLDLGYSFFDGIYVSPMLGVRVGGGERHHFIAGLAYVLQGADLRFGDAYQKGYLHSIQLKLAYQF